MLDLGVLGAVVGRRSVHFVVELGAPFSPLVGGDPRRDREHPRPEVAAVAQVVVAAQGAEERLLEGVLGALPPEQAHEVPEDGVAVLGVEPLERRDRHCLHHPLQR